jgi:hypothetical protein
MVDINFSNIRQFEGSQQKGFEELVCQLAHLESPENANYFVRKEGSGGDAGVECYWKLNDGSEHAWQAKYFLDNLSDGQWNQINKSVKTALNKHPKITKYYISLPKDRTDSRKVINGTPSKSELDKWKDHVKKWKKIAEEKEMNVEFIFWGKHDLCLKLQQDTFEYAGRALYWFSEPFLNTGSLIKIAEKSKELLGERFTADPNIKLHIAEKFDCIGLTKRWEEKFKKHFDFCLDIKKEYKHLYDIYIETYENLPIINLLKEDIEKLEQELNTAIKTKEYLKNINLIKNLVTNINENIRALNKLLSDAENKENKKLKFKGKSISKNIEESILKYIKSIFEKAEYLYVFFSDNAINFGVNRSMLLTGEEGIGKSHLLCDLSMKRLADDLPTLFLLGQHYPGGDPLDFICSELDLQNISKNKVFGALDSFGESKNSNFLIIIDAINEGNNREDWPNYIEKILIYLRTFSHISIIFSCKTTYKEYLVPDIDQLNELEHNGFKGYGNKAVFEYLKKYNVSILGTPVLSPEFTNPLFLKIICCSLLNNKIILSPKGLNGSKILFEFYFKKIRDDINRIKRYRPNENIVRKAIEAFVKQLYFENTYGIVNNEARKIINSFDYQDKTNNGESLFDLLINKGVLAYDLITKDDKKTEIVRFTYERFSDFMIAKHIIENCESVEEIAELFKPDNEIGRIIDEDNCFNFRGIIEALGIIIPEKFQKEFIEFMDFKDDKSYLYSWFIETTFINTILWRTPDSISEESLNILKKLDAKVIYDILLSLSTEPDHPWNAKFLNKILSKKTMPERDATWSIYVAENEESIVKTLIAWSINAELGAIENERLKLLSITLLWMTTTSNRKVRDQATKSLSRVLFYIPEYIVDFMKKFDGCNDVYLLERLYASVYGAIVYLKDTNIIKNISMYIYNSQFKDNRPFPNILLRDYARRIIEFAYYKKNLDNSMVDPKFFRPPYYSDWPIENPLIEEVNNIVDETSLIKNSIMGFPGDFGRYIMRSVHRWSCTQINESRPITKNELKKQFAKKLPDDICKKYINYIEEKENQNKPKNNADTDILELIASIKELKKENIEQIDISEININEKEENPWKILEEEIILNLNEFEKEQFRWINGMSYSDAPAEFSRKWAQRWVCKKTYELGWEKKLFDDFDTKERYGYDRGIKKIERIGKKYQWIAFHELLARMADNLIWIDPGYYDVDESKFFGPWQINRRDIDPTLWIRRTGNYKLNNEEEKVPWWQPFTFPFTISKMDNQLKWLFNKEGIPEFEKLLLVTDPKDKKQWFALQGISIWSKKPSLDILPYQDAWYRINSCVIYKKDFEKAKSELKGKRFTNPDLINISSNGGQGYFGEFPWHTYYNCITEWKNFEKVGFENFNLNLDIKYLSPVCEYMWESSGYDFSIDDYIKFYTPSPKIIHDLSLTNNNVYPGCWKNGKKETVFMDPSVSNKGPSYGLIRKDIFVDWLNKNDLMIIWLIGGEKNLIPQKSTEYYGRLIFNGFYYFCNGEINGETQIKKEKGGEI